MNKTKLLIRVLAGAYLLYSAYSLGKAYFSGETSSIPIIVAAVAFLVFGAAFIFTGLKDYKRLTAMEAEEAQAEMDETNEAEAEIEESAREIERKLSIREKARLTANLEEDEGEEDKEDDVKS